MPYVDTSATSDPDSGRAALFAANRSLDESSALEVELRSLGVTSVLAASTLHPGDGQDRHTTNNLTHQDAVTPQPLDEYTFDSGQFSAKLPPLSWIVFEFKCPRS